MFLFRLIKMAKTHDENFCASWFKTSKHIVLIPFHIQLGQLFFFEGEWQSTTSFNATCHTLYLNRLARYVNTLIHLHCLHAKANKKNIQIHVNCDFSTNSRISSGLLNVCWNKNGNPTVKKWTLPFVMLIDRDREYFSVYFHIFFFFWNAVYYN